MAGQAATGSATATYNLMLGIFLKLLGIFVVLYSLAETDPLKARQAEQSLNQRFNIAVSLTKPQDEAKTRSYKAIEDELETKVDFLSSHYEADSDTLVLRLPADIVLSLNGKAAQSPGFAKFLSETLRKKNAQKFKLEIIVSGAQGDPLMRGVSLFVQKMIAQDYPENLLTIGYVQTDELPRIEFRLKQVRS